LTSGSRRRVVAVALALALPASAVALDVKLWPLGRYTRDGDQTLWTALGPLLEFRRTRAERALDIRPLLSLRQRRGAVHDDSADILYPLAASRWRDDYLSFRLLLFTYRSTPADRERGAPPPGGEWTSRFTLFPFVFYRASPTRGVRLSVFPFYMDVDDFLGYQRVQAILFPAYLRVVEARLERRFYAFPFVSTLGGADGRGFHVWPFYGDKEVVGRYHTRFVLWPFHIRERELVRGYGWEERRLDLPFYAAIDGPVRHSRAYGLFAYLHTVDTRRGTESVGTPWPLVVREHRLGESEDRIWRLWPAYGRSDPDGISSRFWAWPAYREKIQDVEDFHYERRDVGLLLWRRQSLASTASGRREDLLTIFPALRAETLNGRLTGQVPALADSLMPKNRGVDRLWAPLYGIVRWDTRSDGTREWSVLWGLVAREHGHLVGPWHIDLGDGGTPLEAADGG